MELMELMEPLIFLKKIFFYFTSWLNFCFSTDLTDTLQVQMCFVREFFLGFFLLYLEHVFFVLSSR